jgi:hypothetical protein
MYFLKIVKILKDRLKIAIRFASRTNIHRHICVHAYMCELRSQKAKLFVKWANISIANLKRAIHDL